MDHKKSGVYSRGFNLVGRVHLKGMIQYASLKWVIGSGNGQHGQCQAITGLILGLCPTNERRRYKVTASLIGWAQT